MRDLKYSKFNLITVSLIAVGLIGLGPLSCDLAPRDQRCDDGLTAESAGELAGDLAGADLCADQSEEGGDEVDQTNSPRRWSVSAHPCVGNRTDALHCDDALTCYVGCGTTTNGRGVYVTTDGGETWGPVVTEPEGVLDQARINDISRVPGGDLYFAGELPNGARVVALDAMGNLREVFTRGTTIDLSFTVGSFRQTSSGRAIAESLTGSGLVYRGQVSDEPDELLDIGSRVLERRRP